MEVSKGSNEDQGDRDNCFAISGSLCGDAVYIFFLFIFVIILFVLKKTVDENIFLLVVIIIMSHTGDERTLGQTTRPR